MTIVAVPLVIVTRRIRGRVAVEGVGHATLSGLAAGAVSAAVGVAVCLSMPPGGKLAAFVTAVAAAACAVITFGAIAYALDRGDLKLVVVRLRRLARSRR
jgi:putative peptidoglycan lipid II flippase